LVSEASGEVELEGKVLVIRRIHVKLILRVEEAHRETVMRVHGFFAENCPVYRSLRNAITMTTEVVFEPLS
jgi:uncharacterized OsmC-like protein